MNIKILSKKPDIVYNDETFKDLSTNSLLNTLVYDAVIGIEYIDEQYEMRPDLICLKWYGNTDNLDILLKANNIFNPFSIKQGDLLIIPSIGSESKIYKSPNSTTKSKVIERYTDISRMSKNEISRLKDIIAKNKDLKKTLKTPLPTNVKNEYTKGTIIENGIVTLATT